MDAGERLMGFISYVVHFLTCLAKEAMTTFPAVQASLLPRFSTIFSCIMTVFSSFLLFTRTLAVLAYAPLTACVETTRLWKS